VTFKGLSQKMLAKKMRAKTEKNFQEKLTFFLSDDLILGNGSKLLISSTIQLKEEKKKCEE